MSESSGEKGDMGQQQGESGHIQELQQKIKEKTVEAENYKNRLADVEEQLKKLQVANTGPENKNADTSSSLENLRLELAKSNELLKERTELCESQERQIGALKNQVTSLREVASITKDLLNIRELEVDQLQSAVNGMQSKITAERDRQNAAIEKMARANEINDTLKKEYQSQLKTFVELKEKYEQKFASLTKENERLKTLIQNGH